jgi:hypothetical protein
MRSVCKDCVWAVVVGRINHPLTTLLCTYQQVLNQLVVQTRGHLRTTKHLVVLSLYHSIGSTLSSVKKQVIHVIHSSNKSDYMSFLRNILFISARPVHTRSLV